MQRDFGGGVGLLPRNRPVAKILKSNRRAGDRAADEGSRLYDPEVAVQKLDYSFARHGAGAFVAVHRIEVPWETTAT